MASTLSEYIESQEELVREAALALPHQFSKCTYSLGPLRQAVYLCITCPEARGLCSACSIACHTDHEQVELFPKRNFRCDCTTEAIAHQCTLNPKIEPENTSNQYGQNFRATFCRCGRPYDAKTEKETMIQCLSCEDWFHESCCNLRERPKSRENTPAASIEPSALLTNGQLADIQDVDDAPSEASSSGLPSPLISGDEYESFVCGACVSGNSTLRRWAGTFGLMMVVRDSVTDSWHILSGDSTDLDELVHLENEHTSASSGVKRPLSPSALEGPDAKRARGPSNAPLSPKTCLAPLQSSLARKIVDGFDLSNSSSSLGTGDIFCTLNFRERWCHCDSCLPPLEANRFLLDEEETYEPPDDPDSGLSLEELGLRALGRLPRDKAIDSIHAFNELRDDLIKFLRPFAQEGKVVNESDVTDFFSTLTGAAKSGRN